MTTETTTTPVAPTAPALETLVPGFLTTPASARETAVKLGVSKLVATAALKAAVAAGTVFVAGYRGTGGRGRPSTLYTNDKALANTIKVVPVARPKPAKAVKAPKAAKPTVAAASTETVATPAAEPVVFVAHAESPEVVTATPIAPAVAEKAVKARLFQIDTSVAA